MSFNLMGLIKDQVTGQIVKHATGALGESEGGITKALGGIFPSILGSMLSKGTEDGDGLMNMIKGVNPSILGDMTGMLSGGAEDKPDSLMNMGGGLLEGLMGDKLGGAAEMVSKMAGIKSGSAMSLFQMATPLLTGLIGKKVADDGLDVGGLVGMLTDQKDSISGALPSGMGSLMGLGNILGSAKDLAAGAAGMATGALSGVADKAGDIAGGAADLATGAVTGARDAASNAVSGAANLATGAAGAVGNTARGAAGAAVGAAGAAAGAAKSGASSLFKWLIPALIGLAVIYFLTTKMCAGSTVGDAITGTIDKGAEMTKNAAGTVADGAKAAGGAVVDGAKAAGGAVVDGAKAAGDAVVDGTKAVGSGLSTAFSKVDETARKALSGISFAAGSAGNQMMDYISGGGEGNGTFRFKNLNFESGKARIAGTSGVEVDNLAAIMKAYPEVKIMVEGYTDSDGQEDSNQKLSEARANAVKARLGAQGIDGSRISVMGYGEANPVADNGTAEGKAQNRRIEVKIMD